MPSNENGLYTCHACFGFGFIFMLLFQFHFILEFSHGPCLCHATLAICSSQVSVWIMFGFCITFVNKLHMGSSLRSPPVDCMLQY